MHSRRFACLLLGMWFAGSLFMQWVASENYKAIDRFFDQPNPSASLRFKVLGAGATRELLRYQVDEENRYYSESWESAQLILGSFFFFFLLFGTREDKFSLLLALLMVIGVALQRFILTPEINGFGRVLDFMAPEVYVPGRRRLPIIQTAHYAIELTKLGLAVLLTLWLVLGKGGRRRSRGDVRQQLNLIDKANYRHVDG